MPLKIKTLKCSKNGDFLFPKCSIYVTIKYMYTLLLNKYNNLVQPKYCVQKLKIRSS